jgi:glycosyltransferase involved in cell wall biosynthesis
VSSPRFSVVIPAYNVSATIEATIRSVYLQTTDDVEIAVVDDGSTDDTVARVESIADERLKLYRQANAGPSAARNLGIARTTGRYVCPLDADDLLFPEFLESMAEALEADEHAGFAYTDAWALDASSGRVRRASAKAYQRPPKPAPRDPEEFLRVLLDRNFVLCCTLIRRSVLAEVGGYADGISGSEDYELWLRIVANGYSATGVDGRLAVYREGRQGSNSSDVLKMARANISVYELVETTYPVDESARAQARAAGERWRQLERRLLDPAPPSAWERSLDGVRALRRRALAPLRWHREAPAAVRSLLEATGAGLA